MSVYILGAGGVGTLLASSLTKQFAVNFIVRNQAKIEHLRKTGNAFQIKRLYDNDRVLDYRIKSAVTVHDIPDEHIEFLLVSVKGFDTIKSLSPLLAKINEKTRILLVQNGMGVVDELYGTLWKDKSKRPIIYQGVISHGVWQPQEWANTYNYNHAGYGSLKVCQIPRELSNPTESGQIEEDDVINALLKSDLNVSTHTYKELLVYQIQKLLVNSCMNSTTSIVDVINGGLANIEEVDTLFTSIVDEGLRILYEAYPSLQSSPLAKELLNTKPLVEFVKHVGFGVNGKNSTSMRQDVLNLRKTEINYINGHIVSKAHELGKEAPVNSTIKTLVNLKAKVLINQAGK